MSNPQTARYILVTTLLQIACQRIRHGKLQNEPLSPSATPYIRISNLFQHSSIAWPHRSDHKRRVLIVELDTTWSSCYFYGANQATSSWIFSRRIQRHPICLQKPIIITTMTTTAIGDDHKKDWMVTKVTTNTRYVMTLGREHIPTVQGFGYNIPRNLVVSSPPNMT